MNELEREFVACGGRLKNFDEFATWAYGHPDITPFSMIDDGYRTKHPELRTVNDSDSLADKTKIMYEEWLKGIEDGKKEENN